MSANTLRRAIIGDMPTPPHGIHHTYAEYLALEAASNVRHEFLNGYIYAMAGGTPEHAAVASAITGLLFPQLRGKGCRAYNADLRVRTPSGLSTYPDVTIVCGATERHFEDQNAVTNPIVLIEVLSPSTEVYDRGDKLEHYKSLPSLRQVVLVSPQDQSVELWTRSTASRWSRALLRDGDVAELAIGARLDVYDLFDAAAEPHA
jgi:Uma2 family endonuclease